MKRLHSESKKGGWSGETYLVEEKGKKYVVRKCKTLKKAKHYETIEKKFGKYKILPKLIRRNKKNVIYEYIEGRDLKHNESIKIINQVGKIAAIVNKIKSKESSKTRFNKQLTDIKFNKEKIKVIKQIYKNLESQLKPKTTWDLNDLNSDNFRINKEGQVYFVDIEAIKSRVKLYCIGKGFMRWFKTKKEQENFKKGYNSISSVKFFTDKYKDFIDFNFLIEELRYKKIYGKNYKPRTKINTNKINPIIKKYKNE
jgi:hypothetical protein|tara:strand:+ start:41 stop:805 length:765 start_codon:yes stop_codon:yes gene_type:complete